MSYYLLVRGLPCSYGYKPQTTLVNGLKPIVHSIIRKVEVLYKFSFPLAKGKMSEGQKGYVSIE